MPTAFKATYSDWKLVKTRQVVQIVFEVPLAEADAAYELLGGMPAPASERWFGIAAIRNPESAKPQSVTDKLPTGAKRDWKDLPASQQAAIRINEPVFAAYLAEQHPDEWHETGEADACLKFMFKIESKTELLTNHKALTLWRTMENHYQAWKQVEHA